ncbi:hypothetical protein OSTOST_11939 [Ostertagia ostertagi]
MSGTWEFIKRHKGKIIAGSVLRRYNIEFLLVKLKRERNMSVEEKVQIWEKIKVLSVATHCWRSVFLFFVDVGTESSNFNFGRRHLFSVRECNLLDTFKSQVGSYLGFESEPISDPYTGTNSKQVAANRQIFIQCIEYLTSTGIAKLLDVIEETCNEFCSALSLTDRVNQDNLREVLDSVDGKLSKLEPSFFSKLVAPLSEEERDSKDGVLQLLARLVKALESAKGRETLKVPKEPEVLAKLLPSMPDAAAYGACVSRQAERISKDACAEEFSKLLDCVKKQQNKLK